MVQTNGKGLEHLGTTNQHKIPECVSVHLSILVLIGLSLLFLSLCCKLLLETGINQFVAEPCIYATFPSTALSLLWFLSHWEWIWKTVMWVRACKRHIPNMVITWIQLQRVTQKANKAWKRDWKPINVSKQTQWNDNRFKLRAGICTWSAAAASLSASWCSVKYSRLSERVRAVNCKPHICIWAATHPRWYALICPLYPSVICFDTPLIEPFRD